jgi:hypothetical protein
MAITIEWQATDSAILSLETTQSGGKITLPNSKLSSGAIAGIAGGIGGSLVLLAAFLVYRCYRSRKHNKLSASRDQGQRGDAELDAEKTERPGAPEGIEVHSDVSQHISRDVAWRELPASIQRPQAELDVSPAQALADSTPLVELAQSENETPQHNVDIPIEVDSTGILELPQSKSPRGSALPDAQSASPQPYKLDSTTPALLLSHPPAIPPKTVLETDVSSNLVNMGKETKIGTA